MKTGKKKKRIFKGIMQLGDVKETSCQTESAARIVKHDSTCSCDLKTANLNENITSSFNNRSTRMTHSAF